MLKSNRMILQLVLWKNKTANKNHQSFIGSLAVYGYQPNFIAAQNV